jgi:predicted kinase
MRKRPTRLLIVTGLPATGKTTLARTLAQRWCAPLLAKDAIKEPLLDVLGAPDAAASRVLSDASFAVLFALARGLLEARVSAVLEGNFRPGEHAGAALELARAAACAQVLCVADEPQRLRRLAARASDPARHAGHRDAERARTGAPGGGGGAEYLNIPGERFLFTGAVDPELPDLLERVDRWWRAGGRTS